MPRRHHKAPIDFSIIQKIILGFGLAALLLVLIAVITYRSTRKFLATAGAGAHTRQVLEVNETLRRHLMETESAERGFLITGDSTYLLTYTSAWVLIPHDVESLKNLTADNPRQQTRIARLRPLIMRKLAVVNENISARQMEGDEKASVLFEKGEDRIVMLKIRDLLDEFEKEEQHLLVQRTDTFVVSGRATTIVIVIGTLAGILFLTAASWMIFRDVMARRKAEDELARERNLLHVLIETIPYLVYVKDLEGRYLLDNASHRRYIGVKDMSEVRGKKTSDFFPSELAAVYEESDFKVIDTGEPILNQEEPTVDLEGNLVWHSTSKAPLHDINGKLVGAVCLSANITERKRAEEKLRHFAAQMARSNQELQEFASVASHDLQEPLRKILAFGDRLKTKCSDGLGAQGREYLERMQDAANRMRTLINDLLTLSRVTSVSRPFEEVDLAEIAAGVVSDLELRIEQTGASLELGFLPKIEADPVQMRQLIQNLLSNALKFHEPNHKPVISISAKLLDVNDYHLSGAQPGSEVCRMMVKDNGIGFDEEHAERVFALFHRLHGRSEYEGTGIGLAVCRKITDRHGGSIMAKSTQGDGATFIVTLPVKQNTPNP